MIFFFYRVWNAPQTLSSLVLAVSADSTELVFLFLFAMCRSFPLLFDLLLLLVTYCLCALFFFFFGWKITASMFFAQHSSLLLSRTSHAASFPSPHRTVFPFFNIHHFDEPISTTFPSSFSVVHVKSLFLFSSPPSYLFFFFSRENDSEKLVNIILVPGRRTFFPQLVLFFSEPLLLSDCLLLFLSPASFSPIDSVMFLCHYLEGAVIVQPPHPPSLSFFSNSQPPHRPSHPMPWNTNIHSTFSTPVVLFAWPASISFPLRIPFSSLPAPSICCGRFLTPRVTLNSSFSCPPLLILSARNRRRWFAPFW